MWVDGGANCHGFGDKHLFCILFVRTTYVHISGGSTFSDAGVGLVPVVFPGYPALHSLAPAYWTLTDCINTLFISSPKLYSLFFGSSHESLSYCTFCNSQGHTFFVRKTSKNIIYNINLHVLKNYQSHPTGPRCLLSPCIMSMSWKITAQFIHKRFGHASHCHILQTAKLGIYTGL